MRYKIWEFEYCGKSTLIPTAERVIMVVEAATSTEAIRKAGYEPTGVGCCVFNGDEHDEPWSVHAMRIE